MSGLYQELILDHAKNPQHAGLREPFNAEVHHRNTSCGDEVTLRVTLAGAGESAIIEDVSYDSTGCSISTAALSVLADEVIGRSVGEAIAVRDAMRHMLGSRGKDAGDETVIGDGVAFAGVAQYPARVKCALLGWSALSDALIRAGITPELLAADPAAALAPRPAGTTTENTASTITEESA